MTRDVANHLLRDFAVLPGRPPRHPGPRIGADVTAGAAAPEELLAATPQPAPNPDATAGSSDTGICGGDVPPLIGQVPTGTGLTLARLPARLERGEPLPGLTDVQQAGFVETLRALELKVVDPLIGALGEALAVEHRGIRPRRSSTSPRACASRSTRLTVGARGPGQVREAPPA